MNWTKGCLLLVALLFSPALKATDLTTVLQPGWWKVEVEPRFEVTQQSQQNQDLQYTQNLITLPFLLHYGLSQGIEGALSIPFNWLPGANTKGGKNSNADRAASTYGQGFGDMSIGIKFKLLEDTGRTPAFFMESLLKLPTGSSSLEAYSRSLAGLGDGRGTGSGGLDITISSILSAYVDPFECYSRVSLVSRGSDDRNVNGNNEHVDYGGQTQALGGLEKDFGDRVTLALETLAVITQASCWTENGKDILDSQGSSVEAFRLATLVQSGINLATTTEWYVGPIVKARLWSSTYVSLRGEAGLTRDSKPWRLGVGLSSTFYPGFNLLEFITRRSGKGGKTAGGAASLTPTSAADEHEPFIADDGERGNLQRWVYKHFRTAKSALADKKWKTLAAEVALLEEVGAVTASLEGDLKDMQDQLAGLAQSRCQEAEAAQGEGDWVRAVTLWREAFKYRPGWPGAKEALESNASVIQEESRKLYLQGVDAYANGGNYREAAKFWNDALVLTPKDPKILDSLAKARGKLGAIEKLKNE